MMLSHQRGCLNLQWYGSRLSVSAPPTVHLLQILYLLLKKIMLPNLFLVSSPSEGFVGVGTECMFHSMFFILHWNSLAGLWCLSFHYEVLFYCMGFRERNNKWSLRPRLSPPSAPFFCDIASFFILCFLHVFKIASQLKKQPQSFSILNRYLCLLCFCKLLLEWKGVTINFCSNNINISVWVA